MPAAAGNIRTTLAVRHPESSAWLALYDGARAAMDDPAWSAAVPEPAATPPFIDGTTLAVDARAVTRLVGALVQHPKLADDDALALLEAAIAEDDASVRTVATRAGLSAAITAAAAALATMPLMQACRRAWAAKIPAAWNDATCAICGAWAAFVEVRGLERRLAHRCARCGNRDHGRLTALVSERAQERARVEACLACSGYLKTITLLTATPAADVALLDLETVHLDVAAIEHDFRRPSPMARRVSLRAARSSRWR